MAEDLWVSQNRAAEARRLEEAALASKYGPFAGLVFAGRAMNVEEEARRQAYIREASGITPPSRAATGVIGGAAAAAPTAAPDDGSYARKELARARSVAEGFTGSDLSKMPVITNMGFGITKRSVPGETTEYSNIDPATGRPRAYAAPYVAADGTPTADWTKTAAYAEGVKRAEKDITEAALLDIGEAARRTSGASGERERKAAIARARLRLDPTGGAAARRAEVATGVTAQQLAQAARLNQLQAQYLAETDPVKQASLAAQLQAMSGKGEEFKGVELSGGERVETVGGVQVPVRQPSQLALIGSRGTVRPVPVGQPQPAARPKDLNEFLAKARLVNPGMSDAELTAQYNRLYGKK